MFFCPRRTLPLPALAGGFRFEFATGQNVNESHSSTNAQASSNRAKAAHNIFCIRKKLLCQVLPRSLAE
jgi:hypothetical protein